MLKHRQWKMGLLLLFPTLFLLMLGLLLPDLQATPNNSLSFDKVLISPLGNARRNRIAYTPDTRVEIKINIAPTSLRSRIYPVPDINGVRVQKSYLSDARGTKYFWTSPPSVGPRGPINFGAMSISANDRTHSYFYQLNLAQYPKSVGTLKLNTTFVAKNGFKLPISVVVRP